MKAIHILSHNAVVVRDGHGRICVVVGKGVGFRKKKGDRVDPKLVKQVFIEDCTYKKKLLASHN